MFTGIVEGLGRVRGVWGGALLVDVVQGYPNPAWRAGESVAINGCCLTLTEFDDGLKFDMSNETLVRTTLGSIQPGTRVNLERAMAAQGRFGGHIVQGHVDGTGEIVSMLEDDGARVFRFDVPEEYEHYLIDKGSVAVDGVSLTVVRPEGGVFDAWVVPHTLAETNLGDRVPGDRVNLEFDLIAKYVERLLRPD